MKLKESHKYLLIGFFSAVIVFAAIRTLLLLNGAGMSSEAFMASDSTFFCVGGNGVDNRSEPCTYSQEGRDLYGYGSGGGAASGSYNLKSNTTSQMGLPYGTTDGKKRLPIKPAASKKKKFFWIFTGIENLNRISR